MLNSNGSVRCKYKYTYDKSLGVVADSRISLRRPPFRAVSSPGRAPASCAPAGAADPTAPPARVPCAAAAAQPPQNPLPCERFGVFCDSCSPQDVSVCVFFFGWVVSDRCSLGSVGFPCLRAIVEARAVIRCTTGITAPPETHHLMFCCRDVRQDFFCLSFGRQMEASAKKYGACSG